MSSVPQKPPRKRPGTSPNYHAQHAWYEANKEKAKAAARAHYAQNKEKRQAQIAAYREENREQILASYVAYNAAHKEERLAYIATWVKAHRTQVNIKWRTNNQRRRAQKLGATLNDFTEAQWREIQAAYDHRCVYCGRKMKRLTQDHITPLVKGGNHTLSNIVPACASCNSRKHTKGPLCPVQPLFLTLAERKKP